MKLILTAAVDNLGVEGDIVEVKPGYGRNYLLPRGLAVVATKGSQKHAEELIRARQSKLVRDRDHARELKEQLDALEGVSITVKTSEKGKLFGSVMASDVAKAIAEANGPTVDSSMIKLDKGHVKTTGSFSAPVVLASDIEAVVNFEVVASNAK
ncbi:50S ribosomal protein L9 [Corynebacterium choanae]|uniref:Large ribosomal subunit protein bL9 n=1 Tax=Corynebacterium choanae TaxID=1862358 RepID=A0A3G6J352_9CORY|nr:50S ribosomal protein L9 [Corynebacterium choanae]AZA12485.1 50S ribosomal protein L9 [Corynebacterium choanae]